MATTTEELDGVRGNGVVSYSGTPITGHGIYGVVYCMNFSNGWPVYWQLEVSYYANAAVKAFVRYKWYNGNWSVWKEI